jgi:hypothetical protein
MRNRVAACIAGLSLAGSLGLAASAASPAGAATSAHRCVVTVGNTIQQGHGGWYRAKILHACKGVGVVPEIQCRDIRNHNFNKYGRRIFLRGRTSKVACGTTLVIKEAWVIAGGHKQEVWPHHT